MTTFHIVSSEGIEMGIYEGSTPEAALDAMARDAGYVDQEAAEAEAGKFTGTIAQCFGDGEWQVVRIIK